MTRLFGILASNPEPVLQNDRAEYAANKVSRVRQFLDQQSHGSSVLCGGTGTARQDDISIVLIGKPHWLGSSKVRSPETMASQVCDAYFSSGLDFLPRLGGSFAVAIVDSVNRCVHLGVDRLGIEKVCYSHSEDTIVFGSSATDVARTPGMDASHSRQALYNYLFMHMIPAPMTIYRNVSKLESASVLTWRNGCTSINRYWKPVCSYVGSTYTDLKTSLFEGLRTGTHAAGIDDRSGAFLSGGLDSSTVAGILAEFNHPPARTFTVGFGEAEYNEVEYARITARHFGCMEHEYIVQPSDIVTAFPTIAAHFDEPFGNSSAVPSYFCALLAKQNGVDHLLAGDGGDELFGGNERYAQQRIFEVYGNLPSVLRRMVFDPLSSVINPECRFTPLRKYRSYVDQASIPLPDRFESWNFVFREGHNTLLNPDFAESVNLHGPIDRMREVWASTDTDNLLDHMLHYDWQFTLADNDLRKVGAMCELADVRVSFPMLHSEVVDMSLRVPPRMKMRGLQLRSFYRRAMKGFLANETLRKSKHGFGLPFGVWLKSHEALSDMIYDHLADLRKRRIVSASFIDNLVNEHRAGHPSYFGYAIWDLAMLEAWLQAHDSTTGQV